MTIKKSSDIDKYNDDEQYETGNEGEREYSSPKKGGEDGAKLNKAMNRKYPKKQLRGKEYR